MAEDIQGATAEKCRELQLDLIATYRADFAKYGNHISTGTLDSTLLVVSRSLGRKFVYSHAGEGIKQTHVKRALDLLAAAKVCSLVKYSAANGLPLGGEAKDSFRKVFLNDIGLLNGLLRTPASDTFPSWETIAPQIRGQMAEQVVGQQLRLLEPASGDGPELFYWQREGGRPGEIDFLVQVNGTIIPVELKSGTAGSMKNLHQFMHDKSLAIALRFDLNQPSVVDIKVKTTLGNAVNYRLHSLPLYLAGMADKIVGGD